jgi:hypothetical protein
MSTLFIVAVCLVAGFVCGFIYAKQYYAVDRLMRLMALMTDLMTGKITSEEAQKRMKELADLEK